MPLKTTLVTLMGQTFGSGDAIGAEASVGALDDNVIRLGDQNYPIRGISVAEQVSEFEAGIKIGPATYDNREHAFFMVMNDFSAGMGFRFLNVREELGGFWYSGSSDASYNAADVSRAKYIILPPKQTQTAPTAPTVSSGYYYDVYDQNRNKIRGFAGAYWFVHGSALYYSMDGGATFAKAFEHPEGAHFNTFSESFDPIFGASILILSSDRNDSFVAYDVVGTGIPTESYGPAGPPYGLTWALDFETQSFRDTHYWDGKVLILDAIGAKFGVWTQDPDTYVLSLSINTMDPLDGEWIVKKTNQQNRWVGTGMAPWGQPSMYFHDGQRLYALDFFARKYYPIEFGLGRQFINSCIWNGAFELTDGHNLWEYNPNGQTVRNIGLYDKQGLPPTIVGTGNSTTWRMNHLVPVDKDLYAVFTTKFAEDALPKSALYKYNGNGWSQIGKRMNFFAVGATHIAWRTGAGLTRRIVVWGQDTMNVTSTMSHAYFDLPASSDTPVPGRGGTEADHFGESGADFVTGWLDGGFLDIDGTLLRMRIDAMHLTSDETVKVEYQLDNDETTSWTQMVDENNAPAVFNATRKTLYFSSDVSDGLASYNPRQGIRFNTVRFRVTLTRGSDDTLTPILQALILMYIKVPDFRLSATFSIDINRMLEERTDTQFYVNGAVPTLRTVHQKLISQWNEHLLHHLTVPNVIIDEDNAYVRIVGMPLRFEDFKDSVAGRGTIELTVLEPLERVE